jgi:tetratricopeptide (TPR) repeat protein
MSTETLPPDQPTATQAFSMQGRGPALPKGTMLGRYVVLEQIGEGGMGSVYAAYDPELDRRVALKVLRGASDAGQRTDVVASARLLHEARALARLQHPNVLRIYDVGVDGGRVFFATELLAGVDVGTWATEEKRSWQQVLDVFLEAGKGLAAAHEQGLVHRDVKPSNMMVCADGRVLLVDFGIAGEIAGAEGAVVDPELLGAAQPASRVGDLLPAGAGTPGSMAPEQARGEEVGPAADQYAFCLALHRVLLGREPGGEGSTPGDSTAARSGAAGYVPFRRLRPWLRRGLAADPAERHPSMTDLLAGLGRVRTARKRLALSVAAGATLLLLLAAGHLAWRARTVGCFDGRTRFEAVWNGARQNAFAARFASLGGAAAKDLATAASAAIASYGAAWQDQGEAWCQEGKRGAASAELLDLRNACLDQRLRELDASLAVALSHQELPPERLAEMFGGLTPIAACADTRALRAPAEPTLDATGKGRLEELRGRQAEARALWSAGVFAEGRTIADDALAPARQLGHWPLVAELLVQRGLFEDALVDDRAATTLQEAVLVAAASRHNRATAEALIRQVRVAGLRRERFDDARQLAVLARTALGGLSRPELLEADLADFEGLVARQEGAWEAALERHRHALEVRRRELGHDHAALATSHLRLANLLDDLDQQARAREHLEQALSIQQAQYGGAHPSVAETHTRLGSLAREAGDLELARRHHEKALTIRRQVYGESRPPVAESRTYLGELAALAGDFATARREFEAALALITREMGERHSSRGIVLATMASAWTEAGLDQEAISPYRQALEIFEAAHGPEHPQVGVLLFNLGSVHLRLGDYPAARQEFEHAAGIFRKAVGERHSLHLNALGGWGEALERLGAGKEARILLERAMAHDGEVERGAKFRADSLFALARLLVEWKPPETSRALALAEQARALYAQDAVASRRELAELTAWLARRPRS